jgi:isopenicillin N synthase-like dioxygenase
MSQSIAQEQSNLKVAYLETIDFAKLLAHEEHEVAKLMSACTTAGFFYVNLQGQSSRGLLEDEDSMYKAMEECRMIVELTSMGKSVLQSPDRVLTKYPVTSLLVYLPE